MYIRFITPKRIASARGAADGIFDAAHLCWLDKANPVWLRKSIRDELDWFNENLRIPKRFGIVTRKSNRPYSGICWFRDGAHHCIQHSRLLCILLREAGTYTSQISTVEPGDIVYRDDLQIVAMPRMVTEVNWK
ncbi:hypothetical protein PUV54_16385 [Hyphococcus flavus]|uniref:Uncharacterized protein n=1 Tax=Hyphococcus flavus TaxID=1866326 RepID=A0AAE9ZJA6_9PROT|nr:hypothetical protein [Hyphococcus flavus]WDI31530.1 hypothetical protein PUV54_16385 [Hyphococcus flavus]